MLRESIPRAPVSSWPSKSQVSWMFPIGLLLTTFASLPEGKDDRTLEAALTREFSKYGTVFVKIRRDSQNMPFAFCQYTVRTNLVPAILHIRCHKLTRLI